MGDWLRTPDHADRNAAGRALAQLHLTAADYPGQRVDPMGTATCQSLAEACESPAVRDDRRILDRLQAELARVTVPASDLPTGAIHADYFPDNVLFDDGAVSGVIDFYFACVDVLAYDLAIALNAWGFDAAGDVMPPAIEAFLAGYESVRPLTTAERATLPDQGARAVVRFTLTRLHDRLQANPDALVTAKDPAPFLRRLDYWRGGGAAAMIGLT